MKKLALITGMALIATAGAALAQTAEAPRPARPDRNADVTRQQVIDRADQRFARLDLNRDGRFTPEEARQLGEQRRQQRADRMFDRLDANRDGSITREEMNQARAQREQARTERRQQHAEAGAQRAPRGRHGMRFHGHRRGFAAGGQRLFGEQGFVTAEQFRARAVERFDRLDADHDGTVTAAERQQARAQMREQFRQRMQERRGQTQS